MNSAADTEIREEPLERISDHLSVSAVYTADIRYNVEPVNNGLGGLLMVQENNPSPAELPAGFPDEEMLTWPKRWDTSLWAVLSAWREGARVGGAVVGYKSEDIYSLEGRKDLAALADLRVDPSCRRQGIGTQLFQAAAALAHTRGCRILRAETRNINVPACRLFARQGCRLGKVDHFAYSDRPNDVQLVWYMFIG